MPTAHTEMAVSSTRRRITYPGISKRYPTPRSAVIRLV
jgi:hypothetical protein